MNKRAGAALGWALTAGIALVGCSPAAPATPGLTLEQTAWRAVGIETLVPVGGSEPTISFASGRLRGSGGCNTYSGTYALTGGSFDADSITATLRECEDRVSELERMFLRVLVSADTVTIDTEAGLVLAGPGGTVRFLPDAR